MTTLSPVEPDVEYFDLESLICDAVNMTDVLTEEIRRHFENNPPPGGYVLDAQDGNRLFFVSGMVMAMTDKVLKAYYLALENERRKKASGHVCAPSGKD